MGERKEEEEGGRRRLALVEFVVGNEEEAGEEEEEEEEGREEFGRAAHPPYYSYTTDGGRGAPVRVRVKLFSFSPRKSKESCQEVSFGLLAASLPIGTVEGATLLSEAAQIGGRRSNRREKKKKILSIEITRTF